MTSDNILPLAVRISKPNNLAIVGAMSISLAYSILAPSLIPFPEMIKVARASEREGK
jgi:hypothetical protein